jgi:ParB-like chromosome segregation protein Spo0J
MRLPLESGQFMHQKHLTQRRAVGKAGLGKVWAWVEPMDDDAALMELVLSNRQGELSPLEIGMHVLKAVPLETGGRGKEGGLSEYAKAIGKSNGYLTQVRQAAEVLEACKPFSQLNGLLDKAQHLAAIHALPRERWPAMVADLVEHGWSAAETRERVKAETAGQPVPAMAQIRREPTCGASLN